MTASLHTTTDGAPVPERGPAEHGDGVGESVAGASAERADTRAPVLLGVVVVPDAFDGATPLLGLSPLLRHALAMQAAGCSRVVLVGSVLGASVPPDPRLSIPVGVRPSKAGDTSGVFETATPFDVALIVRADVTTHRLVPPRIAKQAALGPSGAVRIGDAHAGYYAATADRTFAIVAELGAGHDAAVDRSLELVLGVSAEFVVRANTKAERRNATWKHLVSLRKPQSGYFERLYMRPMSMFITWPLANTRVTPNQMSLVTFALGIASAVMVGMPDTRWNVAGAFVHLFMRVVDCVDGELSRLRYQGSKLGAWLDSICDGISMAAFVFAIGYRLDALDSPYAYVGYFGAVAWMGVQLLEWRGAYLADTGGSVQTIEWGHRAKEQTFFERFVARFELLMRIDAISTYYGVLVMVGAFAPLVVLHSVMSVAAIAYYVGQLGKISRA
jgi:phosphatidylglycerophosphate synthase